MASYKLLVTFRYRQAGWSESYYWEGASHTAAMTQLNIIARKRMVMMGKGVECPVRRVSVLLNPRDRLVDEALYVTGIYGDDAIELGAELAIKQGQGYEGFAPDMSFTALKTQLSTGNPSAEGFLLLRGLPDFFFVRGNLFSPDISWRGAFEEWREAIRSAGCCIYVVDPAVQIKRAVSGITAAGNTNVIVTPVGAPFPVAGQMVRIGGAQTSKGLFRGTFKVLSTTVVDFTLDKTSQYAFTYLGGAYYRILTRTYNAITDVKTLHCVSRRAGRPFGAPVGRHKKAKILG